MFYKYTPDPDKFASISIPQEKMPNVSLLKKLHEPLDEPPDICRIHRVDTKISEHWTPPVAEVFEDNPPREGDFPSLSNFWTIPVFSERAWEALSPVIGAWCEPLPILYPSKGRHYLVHVLKTLDCLDVERSKVFRRKTDQSISVVLEYSFKPDVIDGIHIFKMTPETGGVLIVDDVFRAAVEKNKLKGLLFRPLKMAE